MPANRLFIKSATWMVALISMTMMAALAVGAASAFAASPWWHVTAEPVPTHLDPANARDEVLEVSVTATEGDVLWAPSFKEFAVFPFNAEAGEVQSALEGVYGAGGVQVGGGPVGGELHPYTVTIKGRAIPAGAIEQIETFAPFGCFFKVFKASCLSNGEESGSVHVVQKAAGRAAGEVVVTATNLGRAAASGETEPIIVSDALPAGFQSVGVSGVAFDGTAQGVSLECSLKGEGAVSAPACSFGGKVYPYTTLTLRLQLDAVGAKEGEEDQASVSGGGVRPLSVSRAIPLGESTPFGIADYELVNENEGGGVDTQAGSHPFQQTTTVIMNQIVDPANGFIEPAELPKDLHFFWPAGLIGNPTSLPQCPLTDFLSEGACPADTAIGVAKPLLTFNQGAGAQTLAADVPVFNLAPSPGEPARFGFRVNGVPVYIDPSVRSGRDYGITVNTENISQLAGFRSVEVTVWGVPGDPRHDAVRGEPCLGDEKKGESCVPARVENPEAFLSLPTACPVDRDTGLPEPLVSSVTGDSWGSRVPTDRQPLLAESVLPAMDGCAALPFSPGIVVTPDSREGSRPTGLNVDVHVPQQETLNPAGLAVSDVRNITVALPEGLAVNPSSADGLLACSEGLVGFEGFGELGGEPGVSSALFAPRLPGSIPALNAGEEAPLQPGVNFCPDASKIGEVTIKTPLLPEAQPLKGSVYLAAQTANPFGSLLAMYLVAEDPVSGSLARLAGEVHLSETGQLVTTFENSPQVAFEDAELHFFGGERAPLASPARCSTYPTTASITSWSGGPGVPASSSFPVTTGPNGSPCTYPGQSLPFSPTLTAGVTSLQAGGFTPFTTTFSRADGQQDLKGVQLRMPLDLIGLVSSVTPCPEAQANAGTCPASSLIGHTIVSVGVGGDPYSVTGGEVFLTESYKGAAYGLSVVNPAVAGPFNLGKVIVRARVDVDPLTAQLTVTTDTTGPYAIPHILDGIPLQIQHINVTIDREHFIFNPTSCNPIKLTGDLEGLEGATSALSDPFQVTNCAILGFKPKLSVSTSGKVTKQGGTSFSLKLAYPPNALGKEAWFKEATFVFPKQLPARLTTLQKACLAATFSQNPENCPPGSRIGTMTVATPVLPGLLHGSVYFVSYGGQKFPEAVFVLKGEGTAKNVAVDLHAETFISKKGVTSATLHAIPGVPFSNVQVTLPAGPDSEFTNNGLHPCREHLAMKTSFTAQNNLKQQTTTPLTTTSCHKHKHHKK